MAGFRTTTGAADAQGMAIAIVASRFNEPVVDGLIGGAIETLQRMGAETPDISVTRVPGAWELPLVVQEIARAGHSDAIIALGAIIRGETPHFDFLSAECTSGLLRVSLEFRLPVAFGVLTCNTNEQAEARSGSQGENKGAEAAIAAVETAQVLRRLDP